MLCLTVGMLSAPAAARSPKVTFYFGLERPEARARDAFTAVSQPGSPSYRRFLGVRRVAVRYGASRRTILAFRRAARRHGLATRMDRSGVFARVSGTVERFERVLGKRIRRSFDNDTPAVGYSAPGVRPPRLPRDLRRHVREVVASYDRSPSRGWIHWLTASSMVSRSTTVRRWAKYMGGTSSPSRSMYCQTSSSVQLEIGKARMCSPFRMRLL